MLPDPWLDEDTVTAGLRPSKLPDRAQLLDLILSAVPSASTSGIVVVGERGSGKSHLLLSVKEGLPETVDVRTFTGKPERRALHFGALGAVSAAEADEAVAPGLHVLRALTSTLGPADYLYTPPRGRRRSKRHVQPARPQLVLLVDDIHYIDPASLAVLLQLIPGFGATLVATAESRHPLPPDLYQLWEDGFLEQYFLPPFTFSEAHALCESVLGGHVQRRASSLLAAMSGFNVGLLCLADQRRTPLRFPGRKEGSGPSMSARTVTGPAWLSMYGLKTFRARRKNARRSNSSRFPNPWPLKWWSTTSAGKPWSISSRITTSG